MKYYIFKLVYPLYIDPWDDYIVSDADQYIVRNDNTLRIPEFRKKEAIIEVYEKGCPGVNEVCSRIFLDGISWLVLGNACEVLSSNETPNTKEINEYIQTDLRV